jgi:hypothetical protein
LLELFKRNSVIFSNMYILTKCNKNIIVVFNNIRAVSVIFNMLVQIVHTNS